MTGELDSREAAVVLLTAPRSARGRLLLDDDECMCCDLANGGLHLDAYAEGIRLLRDEIRQLLRERGLCDVIQRSWPPLSPVLH
jgi:hypothetical protein